MPDRTWSRILLVGLLSILVSACASGPRPGEAPIPDGARVTHRAVFIGESYHDTVGTVSVYESDEPAVIVFEPNFSVSGDTEAVVALGRDGYESGTALGQLFRRSGRQAYALPEELPVRRFNEVWLWSVTKDKPIGLARLVPI